MKKISINLKKKMNKNLEKKMETKKMKIKDKIINEDTKVIKIIKKKKAKIYW